ncbi:hypothetical protein GS501_04520 [Saccharibacter sp. 17.LH.SD]|uniref:hypothetical protein n=1 Tax=Saccharibacter sp. 17.LH.SD TaxID=2689393 RepID=UPI001369FFD8|nr:hypothetical protein [Saccharibacter sp. 17.LH.SD]MXV44309.1 hypothetical protein [Saccharibacter sp. 17.LH.SD]
MRVWTRQHQPDGSRHWVAVDGDQAIIAWLQNALLLQLGESPFWVDWGIPITQTLLTQVWPDYYTTMTQQRFAGYFASLTIIREPQSDNPAYRINAILPDGTTWQSGKNKFNQSFSQTGPY